jgi:hypothetical protein
LKELEAADEAPQKRRQLLEFFLSHFDKQKASYPR